MPLDPQEIFPEGICETNNIYYSSSFITKYNALCKERYFFINFIYFSSRIANSLGPLVMHPERAESQLRIDQEVYIYSQISVYVFPKRPLSIRSQDYPNQNHVYELVRGTP